MGRAQGGDVKTNEGPALRRSPPQPTEDEFVEHVVQIIFGCMRDHRPLFIDRIAAQDLARRIWLYWKPVLQGEHDEPQ